MTLEEQELVIRIARDETHVTITGTGAYWIRQLEKLLSRVPGEGAYLSAEVYRISVPATHLRLLAPKRQSHLTDEQRAQIGNRLKNSLSGIGKREPNISGEGGDSHEEIIDDDFSTGMEDHA